MVGKWVSFAMYDMAQQETPRKGDWDETSLGANWRMDVVRQPNRSDVYMTCKIKTNDLHQVTGILVEFHWSYVFGFLQGSAPQICLLLE
jgi:hypothetical protein